VIAAASKDAYGFNYEEIASVGIQYPRHIVQTAQGLLLYHNSALYELLYSNLQLRTTLPELAQYLQRTAGEVALLWLGEHYLGIAVENVPYTDKVLRASRGQSTSLPTMALGTVQVPSLQEREFVIEYTRVLIYDTSTERWGSCDIPVQTLWLGASVKDSAFNIISTATGAERQWGTMGTGINMVLADGTVCLASYENADSFIKFGPIRYSPEEGVIVRQVDLESPDVVYTNAYTLELLAYDNADTIIVNPHPNEVTVNQRSVQYPCWAQGHYVTLLVQGVFHLSHLAVKILSRGWL
jgi:hypothetical protein